MIANERQYRVSKAQLEKFAAAVTRFSVEAAIASGIDQRVAQAQLNGLREQHAELAREIAEYEELVASPPDSFAADELMRLPELLIKARIAAGLSQRALAELLNMKEQQIQRYEADGYSGASLARLQQVSTALGLGWSAIASRNQADTSEAHPAPAQAAAAPIQHAPATPALAPERSPSRDVVVVLLKPIMLLGNAGDTVRVAEAHWRTYLEPRGLARLPATIETMPDETPTETPAEPPSAATPLTREAAEAMRAKLDGFLIELRSVALLSQPGLPRIIAYQLKHARFPVRAEQITVAQPLSPDQRETTAAIDLGHGVTATIRVTLRVVPPSRSRQLEFLDIPPDATVRVVTTVAEPDEPEEASSKPLRARRTGSRKR